MPVEPPPTHWAFGEQAEYGEDDLVAVGADLEPGTLLAAYRRGLFPMPSGPPSARRKGPVHWFCPIRRGILPLDGLRVSRSLRRACRDFEVRIDTAFDEVLSACADPRREHGWIDREVVRGYTRLHELGWAHSVEAWRDGRLEGGLYGVAVGGLFAGESMFHRATDASKVALVGLVDVLSEHRVDGSAGPGPDRVERLLDVQWATPHLTSLGVVEVSRADYLARLAVALGAPVPRGLHPAPPPAPLTA